jgi:hypothetical protein
MGLVPGEPSNLEYFSGMATMAAFQVRSSSSEAPAEGIVAQAPRPMGNQRQIKSRRSFIL